MFPSLKTLAAATVVAVWLLAIITCLIGAWCGVIFSDALARATFGLRPI